MSNALMLNDVMAVILAGGAGDRLMPLTADRAKPAVPIAGNLRLIDFVLTNIISSSIHRINVLTQYRFDSLERHIERNWGDMNNRLTGEYLRVVPSQMRRTLGYSKGSAETVYEHEHLIKNEDKQYIAIFGADHVYYMNVAEMVQQHIDKDYDITICAKPMKVSDCPREKNGNLAFGIIETDLDGRVLEFKEKPSPDQIRTDEVFVSMGNYIFNKSTLLDSLKTRPLDFGKDVLPAAVAKGCNVGIYDFSTNHVPGMMSDHEKNFWMDIGTVDSYYEASMMFADLLPQLNLYNKKWALMRPPDKSAHSGPIRAHMEEYIKQRIGAHFDSLVSDGCIISGSIVLHSVLSQDVKVHSYSGVQDSVLFDDVDIGEGSRINKSIIEKHIRVPKNTHIGYSRDDDLKRGFYVSPGGVVVLRKGYDFNHPRGYDPHEFKEATDFAESGRLLHL
jgi:glucose-1-phosphate adenylyltransferase